MISNSLNKLFFLGFGAMIFLLGCDGDEPEHDLRVEDFVGTIPSNPPDGAFLGQIEVTGSAIDVQFELHSEEPAGALRIDASAGVLTVLDGSLFDFVQYPEITAIVEVTSGSAVVTGNILIRVDELTDYELSVVEYFKDIALGFEYGNASSITRRWDLNSTMKIFLGNGVPDNLQEYFENSLQDINELVDPFRLEVTEDESESNCYMYFGSKQGFGDLFPDMAGQVVGNNGLFWVWWNNNTINRSRIFIDAVTPSLDAQKSVVLEELTQALGLGRDSPLYPGSIFYETSSDGGHSLGYSQRDRDIIRLLYHRDMSVGLDANSVDPILRRIIVSWRPS